MKSLFVASLSCAGLFTVLLESAHAHGGIYRGPPDVVPPNPGGGRGTGPGGPATGGPGGPATPGPGGPATPGPAGPAAGGPSGPSGSRPPVTTGRRGGVELDPSFDRWDLWWEFNKDPYIRLKAAIHTDTAVSGSDEVYLGPMRKVDSRDSLKPSDDQKFNDILPALKKAIDSTEQRDINSSCMVAMAKVGRDHPEFKLREVFEPRLRRGDQEIRETAALSLGIAALPDAASVELLIGLAKDTEFGRKACDQREVNDRTRAFATYGLGLLAHANADIALKTKAFAALRELVDDDKTSSRNVKVAAINAIGLLNIGTGDDAGKELVGKALACLQGYYSKSLGAGEQLLQAHVPPAIAKLLGKDFYDPKVVETYRKMFFDDLMDKGAVKRSSNDIGRSCALALGQLCPPHDAAQDASADHVAQLLDVWHDHKDLQTRYFSILAVGQIGGRMVRDILLKEFDRAGRSLEKPWVALAMGVCAFEKYDAQRASKTAIEIEDGFGRALAAALEDAKNPSSIGAFAVALGLCQYTDAADDLRRLLAKHASQDELAGYLCIGLALMNNTAAKDDIRAIVKQSVRRPDLLKHAAIALGRLGDKTVAEELQKLLAEGDSNLAKMAAIASALGFIGDRRSIAPLKQLLFDESLSVLSRAFAAVALGGVADKEDLPWNSKIGRDMNYRAAVETLFDGQAGILDIL